MVQSSQTWPDNINGDNSWVVVSGVVGTSNMYAVAGDNMQNNILCCIYKYGFVR